MTEPVRTKQYGIKMNSVLHEMQVLMSCGDLWVTLRTERGQVAYQYATCSIPWWALTLYSQCWPWYISLLSTHQNLIHASLRWPIPTIRNGFQSSSFLFRTRVSDPNLFSVNFFPQESDIDNDNIRAVNLHNNDANSDSSHTVALVYDPVRLFWMFWNPFSARSWFELKYHQIEEDRAAEYILSMVR